MEIPQDSTKGSTSVHSAVTGFKKENNDDGYYLGQIQNLATIQMNKLVAQIQKERIEKEKMNSKPPLATIQSLKEFITNEINGKDITLVITKTLFPSDLAKNQNRLSMPMNQVEPHEFLTKSEKQGLQDGEEFEVKLVGPRLQIYENPMVIKIWHLQSSYSYVLKANWNEFVKENDDVLQEHTKIQVWSFRKDKRLCFAIACV